MILLEGSRADAGCLGHAGSSFSSEPRGPEVNLVLPFAWGLITYQHHSLCVKTRVSVILPCVFPPGTAASSTVKTLKMGLCSDSLVSTLRRAAGNMLQPPAVLHSKDDGKRKLLLIFYLTKWQSWHFWMNTSLKINIAFAISAQMPGLVSFCCASSFHQPSAQLCFCI